MAGGGACLLLSMLLLLLPGSSVRARASGVVLRCRGAPMLHSGGSKRAGGTGGARWQAPGHLAGGLGEGCGIGEGALRCAEVWRLHPFPPDAGAVREGSWAEGAGVRPLCMCLWAVEAAAGAQGFEVAGAARV